MLKITLMAPSNFDEPMPSLCSAIEVNKMDSTVDLLIELCAVFSKSPYISFEIIGFSDVPWPVDVKTDLSVFLEQIGDLVSWIVSPDSSSFSLDFYEQGIERSVSFSRKNDFFVVHCVGNDGWHPENPTDFISIEELSLMLRDFVHVFASIVKKMCPSIFDSDLFSQWLDRVKL